MKNLLIINVILTILLGFMGVAFGIGPEQGSTGPAIWQGKDFIETQTDLWNKLRGPYSRAIKGVDGSWHLDTTIGKASPNKQANWPPK